MMLSHTAFSPVCHCEEHSDVAISYGTLCVIANAVKQSHKEDSLSLRAKRGNLIKRNTFFPKGISMYLMMKNVPYEIAALRSQ